MLRVPPDVKEHSCYQCSFLKLLNIAPSNCLLHRGFSNQNYLRIYVVRVTVAVHQYLTLNRWNKLAVAQLKKTYLTYQK